MRPTSERMGSSPAWWTVEEASGRVKTTEAKPCGFCDLLYTGESLSQIRAHLDDSLTPRIVPWCRPKPAFIQRHAKVVVELRQRAAL
jgi:hypothetical protein